MSSRTQTSYPREHRDSVGSRPVLAALAALAALSFGVAAAQQPPSDEQPRERREKQPEVKNWWNGSLVGKIIDRISDEMVRQYDFDDDQLHQTRAVIKERLPAWLEKNGPELNNLVLEYTEALLSEEAPTPEAVAKWSQRVMPLVEEFQEIANDVSGKMSEYMTDDQRVILEGEMAAFSTGVGMVKNKLGIWSDGGYDPETEWIGDPVKRREKARQDRIEREARMREARDQAVAEAGGLPPNASESGAAAPDGPSIKNDTPKAIRAAAIKNKDEWSKYVDDFATRYKFTSEQRDKANAHLKAKQEERDRYLTRNGDRLAKAEKQLKDAKSDEERNKAKTEIDKLKAPVDRMFDQLKEKINALPTREQRSKAALANADEPSKKTPEKAEPTPVPVGENDRPKENKEGPGSP